jgi:hypothetical protein
MGVLGTIISNNSRLVRSERIAGKVKQVTLLNLGRHFWVDQSSWPALRVRIKELMAGQASLAEVDLPKATALEAERIVEQLQLHRAPARSASTIVGKDLITIKQSIPKHADAFGGKSRFSFLGFEFNWRRNRNGATVLKRRTDVLTSAGSNNHVVQGKASACRVAQAYEIAHAVESIDLTLYAKTILLLFKTENSLVGLIC